jgi:hypothetical protein
MLSEIDCDTPSRAVDRAEERAERAAFFRRTTFWAGTPVRLRDATVATSGMN